MTYIPGLLTQSLRAIEQAALAAAAEAISIGFARETSWKSMNRRVTKHGVECGGRGGAAWCDMEKLTVPCSMPCTKATKAALYGTTVGQEKQEARELPRELQDPSKRGGA